MSTRRQILTSALAGAAAAALAPRLTAATDDERPLPRNEPSTSGRYRPRERFGLGGVAIGNAFRPTTDAMSEATMRAAWDGGVRHFDTSPWYGLGLSERRFGQFLHAQARDSFVISTKVGRLLKPDETFKKPLLWKDYPPFRYEYDYSAAGTRRSIEDSLNRLGLGRLDIVYIHDLSPDNADMGAEWTSYFDVAMKGAAKELTKMRDEGVIRAWGFGVNTIEPCLRALKESDPDIFLSATQYSLIHHEDDLHTLFPACEERGVSIVVGAPLNSGFLAGVDRYNYSEDLPEKFVKKRAKLREVAGRHGVDLRTAALQFCAAPKVVSSVIPGARSPEQARQNIASMKVRIPDDFWAELKHEKLIAADAPTPKAAS
ncbi:aldo/keto reductase [Paludisphaera mucosa]|uniref:Aldo/keto reductase n=1 Tax=Paludisphaera mucosa TaxID=3030827 RepID=A0ABT6F7N7_9BACT|nr:aldo/keto reductase [Paludisphaera mucosa]MDG3003597.1 aldo/keto reductase [Paludisphaera mucosa]